MGNHWDPEDDKPDAPRRNAPPSARMKQQMDVGCLHSQEDIRLFAEAWLAYELFLHDPLLSLEERQPRVNSDLIPAIRARLPFDCELILHETNAVPAVRSLVLRFSVVAHQYRVNKYTLTLNVGTSSVTLIPRY